MTSRKIRSRADPLLRRFYLVLLGEDPRYLTHKLPNKLDISGLFYVSRLMTRVIGLLYEHTEQIKINKTMGIRKEYSKSRDATHKTASNLLRSLAPLCNLHSL